MLRAPATLLTMIRHTARAARQMRHVEGAERMRMQAAAQQRGAAAMLRRMGIRLHIEGQLPAEAMLIAPNHTSWLDALVLSASFQTSLAGRGDVLGWPLFGWVARVMGVVPVYRDRASATADFVREVQQRLEAGVSVVAFPEGTTTHGDRLLPFRTGMFEAVAGTSYAVLPVYHQIVRAKGRIVTPPTLAPLTWAGEGASLARSARRVLASVPLDVVVRIGAPIPATGETRKTLARRAQQAVQALRDEVIEAAARSEKIG